MSKNPKSCNFYWPKSTTVNNMKLLRRRNTNKRWPLIGAELMRLFIKDVLMFWQWENAKINSIFLILNSYDRENIFRKTHNFDAPKSQSVCPNTTSVSDKYI